jgi:hypothetical protein
MVVLVILTRCDRVRICQSIRAGKLSVEAVEAPVLLVDDDDVINATEKPWARTEDAVLSTLDPAASAKQRRTIRTTAG